MKTSIDNKIIKNTKAQQMMYKNFNSLYNKDKSERAHRLGKLSVTYTTPKYCNMFYECFKNKGKLSVLEVGAGSGQITRAIIASKPKFIKDYLATELTLSGVEQLKQAGINAQQMDASVLKYDDNSFDLVCCFDVMHHVSDCIGMAQEMIRVSRKYVLLIEANGLSIARKLLEYTNWYKKFNENSYTPWQYKKFFSNTKINAWDIKPFLFTPPLVPNFMHGFIISFSELLEQIPVLRWQCSGVRIYIEKG